MGEQRKIKSVETNKEKQETYIKNHEQLNKALENEFFFEALMIEYAILEDRMKSFIYHIGGLKDRSSYMLDVEETEPKIKEIINNYKDEKNKYSKSLNTITSKENVIRNLCLWAVDENKTIDKDDKYLIVLNEQINSRISIKDMLDLLNRIDAWRDYRNEFVHVLMNKNINDIKDKLSVQAKEGKRLAREISNQANKIKYRDKVRKVLNLSIQ